MAKVYNSECVLVLDQDEANDLHAFLRGQHVLDNLPMELISVLSQLGK